MRTRQAEINPYGISCFYVAMIQSHDQKKCIEEFILAYNSKGRVYNKTGMAAGGWVRKFADISVEHMKQREPTGSFIKL